MSNPGGRLLSFGGAIYETVEAHAKTSPPETRLVRFEPTTGSIRRSAPFRGGTTLVVAGGTIWASGESLEEPGLSTRHVTRLDPRSLTILSRVAFPAVPSAMAPSPAGLWVGAGNRLYLVHPEEASVLRTVGLHGRVAHLAVNPTGDHLYVAMSSSTGYVNGFVSERDALTGAFIARGAGSLGYPANGLTATSRGVWVSSATGNFGGAFFYREGTLDRTGRSIEGLQTITVDIAGGLLWIPDNDPGTDLRCADPTTGSVEGAIRFSRNSSTYGLTNVVDDGGHFYARTSTGIVRIDPTFCRA